MRIEDDEKWDGCDLKRRMSLVEEILDCALAAINKLKKSRE